MKTCKIKMQSGETYYVKTKSEVSLMIVIDLNDFIRVEDGWLLNTNQIESFVDVTKENEDEKE